MYFLQMKATEIPKMEQNSEQGESLELFERFFTSQREQHRLKEIIGFGVGRHINLQDFSIDANRWTIDEAIIRIWNTLSMEERKSIIKALRKKRYQNWELLETAITSGDPVSVLFSREEAFSLKVLLAAATSGGMVDCIAIIVAIPDTLWLGTEISSYIAIQLKWNNLPKDLRMQLKDKILK